MARRDGKESNVFLNGFPVSAIKGTKGRGGVEMCNCGLKYDKTDAGDDRFAQFWVQKKDVYSCSEWNKEGERIPVPGKRNINIGPADKSITLKIVDKNNNLQDTVSMSAAELGELWKEKQNEYKKVRAKTKPNPSKMNAQSAIDTSDVSASTPSLENETVEL